MHALGDALCLRATVAELGGLQEERKKQEERRKSRFLGGGRIFRSLKASPVFPVAEG